MRQETGRLDAAKSQIENERRQREALAARLEVDEPALAGLQEQSANARRELRENRTGGALPAGGVRGVERARARAGPGGCIRSKPVSDISNRASRSSMRGRGCSKPSATRSIPRPWSARRRRSGFGSKQWSGSWKRPKRSSPARKQRCGSCATPAMPQRRHCTMRAKPLGQLRARAASLTALQQEALGRRLRGDDRMDRSQGTCRRAPPRAGDAGRAGLGTCGRGGARHTAPGGAGRCLRVDGGGCRRPGAGGR